MVFIGTCTSTAMMNGSDFVQRWKQKKGEQVLMEKVFAGNICAGKSVPHTVYMPARQPFFERSAKIRRVPEWQILTMS